MIGLTPNMPLLEQGDVRRLFVRSLSKELILESRSDIPRALVELTLSCVEINPAARPKSFTEMRSIVVPQLEKTPEIDTQQRVFLGADCEWIDTLLRQRDPLVVWMVSRGWDENAAKDILKKLAVAAGYRAVQDVRRSDDLVSLVLARAPRFPHALAGKAHGLFVSGKRFEALAIYAECLKHYLKDASLRKADETCFVAVCCMFSQLVVDHLYDQEASTGHSDESLLSAARWCAKWAVRLDPRKTQPWSALALASLFARDLRGAEYALEQAFQVDRGNSSVRRNLAAVRALKSGREPVELAAQMKLDGKELLSVKEIVRFHLRRTAMKGGSD
jgi:hypothetical protein